MEESSSKFEALTEDHVFAVCATEAIALEVEKMAQEIMKEKGLLLPGTDSTDGALANDETRHYIVYLTIEKARNDRCPFCNVQVNEEKKKHVRDEHLGTKSAWEKMLLFAIEKNDERMIKRCEK